jgi:hypothetical protein
LFREVSTFSYTIYLSNLLSDSSLFLFNTASLTLG